jgi:hypothetical protein
MVRPRRGKIVSRFILAAIFNFRVDIQPANRQKMITMAAMTINTPNGAPMMVKDNVEGCRSSTCNQTDHFYRKSRRKAQVVKRVCGCFLHFLADVAEK